MTKDERINNATIERSKEVKDLLVKNYGEYIDHHNGSPVMEYADGYVEVVDGNGRHYVALAAWKSRYFSLNELYVKNDQVHLTSGSRGGVIDMRNKTVESAIETYNRKHADFSHDKIVDHYVF